MSDDESGGKKSGYRLEYASSARAKCKGPKPCAGTKIEKGELRFGSLVDFKGNTTFAWRHWGCVTAKVISNMKDKFESADDLDGFEDLEEADQEKIRKAWEDGHVADEDIPETARKAEGEGEDDEDEGTGKKKAKKDDGPGKFRLEYASSGRAKCKGGCDENIGKDYFRIGHEVDFRGNKSFSWQHWGCSSASMVAKIKQSYAKPEEIEGFDELKEAEQDKVKRAWEEGAIPEDDQGPGEPVATEKKKKAPAKKAPAKRAKKADDEDEDEDEKPVKKRARKAKADDDEEEEKPKAKRQATKKAADKAPAKKRATKKKQESEESAEDFGDAIDAVSADEDEEEAEEEPKPKSKRKAAPASKKSSAPPSKTAAKPSSKSASRKKKAVESEDEDYD